MDQPWLPESLAATLREILSCGNSSPFRSYYRWVADEVKRQVRERHCTTVVELGAGTAPISRLLAEDPDLEHVRTIPRDVRPDRDTLPTWKSGILNRMCPPMSRSVSPVARHGLPTRCWSFRERDHVPFPSSARKGPQPFGTRCYSKWQSAGSDSGMKWNW